MNVLYIEDDENIAEIYTAMIVDSFPGFKLIHYNNGLKALEELKNNTEKYSLVISDFNLPNISGGDIFSFVSGQMLGIPFLILSGIDCASDPKFKNFFNSHVRNAILLKPVTFDVLAEKIRWCLDGEGDLLKIYEGSKKNFDEKIPIRSDTFLKINSVPCDIFLRLNDGKFIKIINKKDVFESRLIQKLILKGITHFYVNRSELSEYGESVVNTLHNLLKSKNHKSDEIVKSQLTNKGIEILKSNLMKCGFNPGILKVADDITNLQIDMINANPELDAFLTKFQHYRKLNTDHTRLVSYLLVGILKELTWDSESTLQKMCTAALLHDISLPEDFLGKIILEENLSALSEDESKIYFRHPEESSHIAKNFESFTGGIEQYILEHHELPDGKGFPRKLNYNNVHPLGACLHLADIAADLIWKFEFDVQKVKDEIAALRSFYSRGFYRKPYDGLVKSLKDCKC